MIYKPGFIRVSIPYHSTFEEIDFLVEAVKFVAKEGWKLLPLYLMNPTKGSFRFCGNGNPLNVKEFKLF